MSSVIHLPLPQKRHGGKFLGTRYMGHFRPASPPKYQQDIDDSPLVTRYIDHMVPKYTKIVLVGRCPIEFRTQFYVNNNAVTAQE